ncbi:serine protease easter [Drosophila miranda]|uniref:serine protease easter n=1 Tax=Drosophila miranda TaxID=7229 RepID=UPI0007E5F87F|nr:serine protease easter [Drosophila miranda]
MLRLHGTGMLPVLLLLALQAFAQRWERTMTHFGNCHTADFGRGTCVDPGNCDFYDVDKLDASSKRQCYSRQRPDLVCCPRESNIIPALGIRINNKNSSNNNSGSTTTTERPLLRLQAAPPPNTLPPRPPTSPDQLPQYPYCGTAFASRVFGGSVAGILEFPWTTLLEYSEEGGNKSYVCGAAFIAQRWLVTAAHCTHVFFMGPGRRLTGARLGEWNKATDPDCITNLNGRRECVPPHIRVSIDRILPHEQFSVKNLTNDIALLRLARPVNWLQMQHVEPVCLPPVRGPLANQLVGSAVDVSGWGRTENSESSNFKRKAMLIVQPLDQCQAAFRKDGQVLNDSQLCASGGIGVDSCNGDSGGPLTVEASTPQRDRFVYLAGVVSFGREECGQTEFSGVYTRISSHMDWIEQTIRANRI